MPECVVCLIDAAYELVKFEKCNHHICSECLLSMLRTNETDFLSIKCPVDTMFNVDIYKYNSTVKSSIYTHVKYILSSCQIEDERIKADIVDNMIEITMNFFVHTFSIYDEFIGIINKYKSQEMSLSQLKLSLVNKSIEYVNNTNDLEEKQQTTYREFLKQIKFNKLYDLHSEYKESCCFNLLNEDSTLSYLDYSILNENNICQLLYFIETEKIIYFDRIKLQKVKVLFNERVFSWTVKYFEKFSKCPICDKDLLTEDSSNFIKVINSQVKVCLNCCADTYLKIKQFLEIENEGFLKNLFYNRLINNLNIWYERLRYIRNINYETSTKEINIFDWEIDRFKTHFNNWPAEDDSLDKKEIDEIRRLQRLCRKLC